MPDQIEKFKQADFIKSFREDNPELNDIPDNLLMRHLFDIEPKLKEQILTPDAEAAIAQNRASQKSQEQSGFGRAVLGSLPGIGGVVGGALAGPETGGLGTMLGIPLGMGAGKGLQDIIEHLIGLNETTPTQKMGNITKMTGEGLVGNAIGQGAVRVGESLLNNPGVIGEAGRGAVRVTGKALQPWRWGRYLEEAGAEPKPDLTKIKFNLTRPGDYKMGEPIVETKIIRGPKGYFIKVPKE